MSNQNKTIHAFELRQLYDPTMSANTWTAWIRPIIDKGIIKLYQKKYTPKQVEEIKKHLGEP